MIKKIVLDFSCEVFISREKMSASLISEKVLVFFNSFIVKLDFMIIPVTMLYIYKKIQEIELIFSANHVASVYLNRK